MPVTGIRVPELRDFRADLRRFGGEMYKGVKDANIEISTKVALLSKTAATSLGSVAAKSAPSLRPIKQLTSAGVRLGGARYPFALGAEFGALQYPQFKPWKGNGPDAGYFLYPTIRGMQNEIRDTYLDLVVDKVAARAYPEI